MTKKAVDLTDPDCEPTDEDWAELLQAAGDRVRAETERMAKKRQDNSNPSEHSESDDK